MNYKIIKHMSDFIKSNAKEHFQFKKMKYDVYIDKIGNRYIESNDQTFHLLFLKWNGFTAKWGKTFDENPFYCPFGNEIADIEITKMCRGVRNKEGKKTPCPWCYKANTPNGTYMNIKKFIKLFDKLNESKTMTQIAFGVDAEASDVLNPDIWKILDYTILNGVTPNITVADIDEHTAKNLVKRCGAISVSFYGTIDKNRCYDSVKLLLDEAKKINKEMNINIHCLLSKETYDSVFELINDYQTDSRLKGMGAIVFLSLKQKGRGEHFNKILNMEFEKIINLCFEKHINIGFDSCSANKFLNAIKDRKDAKEMETYIESCESCMFSAFFDVNGIFYPCSFMEKEGDWKIGIDMTKIENFVKDVWNENRVEKWRKASIKCLECTGRNICKFYNV